MVPSRPVALPFWCGKLLNHPPSVPRSISGPESRHILALLRASSVAERTSYRSSHSLVPPVRNPILEQGEEFNLRVIAPSHIRRLEAGILSCGQDMDIESSPFEVRLGWQVDLTKEIS